jgi:hypothetical protein
MEHAAALDLSHFEDPAFYDHLERARRQTTSRIGLLAQLLGIGQDGLTLISLGVALGRLQPVAPVAARGSRAAQFFRGNSFRITRVFDAIPLDARAPATRLPPIRRRQRQNLLKRFNYSGYRHG